MSIAEKILQAIEELGVVDRKRLEQLADEIGLFHISVAHLHVNLSAVEASGDDTVIERMCKAAPQGTAPQVDAELIAAVLTHKLEDFLCRLLTEAILEKLSCNYMRWRNLYAVVGGVGAVYIIDAQFRLGVVDYNLQGKVFTFPDLSSASYKVTVGRLVGCSGEQGEYVICGSNVFVNPFKPYTQRDIVAFLGLYVSARRVGAEKTLVVGSLLQHYFASDDFDLFLRNTLFMLHPVGDLALGSVMCTFSPAEVNVDEKGLHLHRSARGERYSSFWDGWWMRAGNAAIVSYVSVDVRLSNNEQAEITFLLDVDTPVIDVSAVAQRGLHQCMQEIIDISHLSPVEAAEEIKKALYEIRKGLVSAFHNILPPSGVMALDTLHLALLNSHYSFRGVSLNSLSRFFPPLNFSGYYLEGGKLRLVGRGAKCAVIVEFTVGSATVFLMRGAKICITACISPRKVQIEIGDKKVERPLPQPQNVVFCFDVEGKEIEKQFASAVWEFAINVADLVLQEELDSILRDIRAG